MAGLQHRVLKTNFVVLRPDGGDRRWPVARRFSLSIEGDGRFGEAPVSG
jgi:hypothetical protein